MKPKIVESTRPALLAGALLCTIGLAGARASTFVTFSVDMGTNIVNGNFVPGTDTIEAHGTFNSWGALNLVQQGSSTIYTNTFNDTADANGGKMEYKFVIDGSRWETPASGQNRAALLPATSGASLVLPTAFYGDAGAAVAYSVTFQVDVSQQIALGNFISGTSTVEVRGAFNGWAGGVNVLTPDTSILRTNQYGLVTSNVWTGTFSVSGSPGGADDFKYVIATSGSTVWDSPSPVNQDGTANRYFANATQTLPVVNFSDAAFAPIAKVTFSVDMSAVVLTDTNYNSASLTLNGDFNGWSAGIPLTNNPNAANTNIYSATVTSGAGATINYQFRYTLLTDSSSIVYDHFNGVNGGGGNRTYVVPNIANAVVPLVYFNDGALDDYLTQPTPVLFSVDMKNATGTDGHAFDPSVDNVYVNGSFPSWYGWGDGINPVAAPPGFQLFEQGVSTLYTNTIVLPAGTPVAITYKYGIDEYGFSGGPGDNEMGYGTNHYRVVRTTKLNPYPLPGDTFAVPYSEPFLSSASTGGANLAIGPVANGKVQVSWLGRPGAHLQYKADLASATWQDLWVTDGTNWTTGTTTTNGLLSATNWPATSKTFFRLVKTY